MASGDDVHTERLTRDASATAGTTRAEGVLEPGERVDRYLIERPIGAGGMGVVYLATQTEPVRREVALKLCRARWLGSEYRTRFLVERQVLARMNHPAIAQFFDAGTLADGAPYFVMEYVEGGQIIEFSASRGVRVSQRVRLFCEICHGVEHAHRRGVIHRDLKPSNLLVVEVEGRMQPKVIDFGVARALAQADDGPNYAGTPGYMSPEQIAGVADLDTRTDVFSLGVLLYELVAQRRFDGSGIAEKSGEESRSLGSRRPLQSLPIEGLSRLRRAELEAIIVRATAPLREHRYGSASQLAEALERWLALESNPEYSTHALYRLRCLIRRNALTSVVSALALVAVGVLAVQLYRQFVAVREQRDLAEQTAGLLLETFQAADPYTFPGASMSVRALLARSTDRMLARPLEPTVKLRLLDQLGEIQSNLELWDDSLRTRTEAVRLARAGGLDPSAVTSLELSRIRAMVDVEQWDQALAALDALEDAQDPGLNDELRADVDLIRVEIYEYTDRLADAENLLAQLQTRVDATRDPLLRYRWLRQEGRRAVTAQDGGRAMTRLSEAYALAVSMWGVDDARTAVTLSDLALAEALAGDLERAEQHRRSLVTLSENLFGGDSVGLAIDLSNLGAFLQRRGGHARLEEATDVYRRALSIFESRLGNDSADTATAANGLASVLEALGDHQQADVVYERAEQMMRAARGAEHSLVGIVRHNRGRNALAAGRLVQAERLLRDAGGILATSLGAAHPRFAVWQHTMARLRLARGAREEARALLDQAMPVLQQAFGSSSEEVRAAETTLRQLAAQPSPD